MGFGLPSFESITHNIAELAVQGPIGAMIAGAGYQDQAGTELARALGDQSPESIAARNRIKDLTDNHFDGDFHDPRIPDSVFQNDLSDDLEGLYRKAQAIDVAAVASLQQMWKSRAEKLETGLNRFGPEILSAMEESWQGAAARAAAQGISDYVDKARNLVSATKIVADKVEIVKSAVEVTKETVQPPPATGWASTVASWTPGPSWRMDHHRTETAQIVNQTVLSQVYNPGIREGDTGQPRIPLAYNPVQDTGAPGDQRPGSSGGRNGTPGDHAAGSNGDQAPADRAADGSATGDQPRSDQQSNPSGPQSTASQSATPQATAPAGIDSTGTSSGYAPGSQNGSPGGSASGGGYGTPGGSGASGGALLGGSGGFGRSGGGSGSPGGRGGSIPGGPVGATGAATGQGSAANRAGSGSSGMAPGAGRAKGDEDREKKRSAVAEALVRRENGEELTGLDAARRPHVLPPVLGE